MGPPSLQSSVRPMQMFTSKHATAYPRPTAGETGPTTSSNFPEPPSPTSPTASTPVTTIVKSPNPPQRQETSLHPPQRKRLHSRKKVLRVFRNAFRALPIITAVPGRVLPEKKNRLVTGTLFGYRRGRLSFVVQENPRCLPTLVVELAVRTSSFLRELNAGTVRVALECEKQSSAVVEEKKGLPLLDEPRWTMFSNGKKMGFAFRREATDDDIAVMEELRNTTVGVGVIPGDDDGEVAETGNELTFMRAHFEHIVGSRDSKTFHMTGWGVDEVNGPELSIFFVRI